MPMMMEDEIDDLFGDQQLGGITNLPSPSTLPRGLIQRIDDLGISGCSQKIAWSNAGCIASIAGDNCAVTLRNLYCNPSTGLWTLSDRDDVRTVTLVHEGLTPKHLSWNHSGTELAVTDTLGNISVISILTSINRWVSKRCVWGAEDNLSDPVGLMWLNQDRLPKLLQHGPAVKNPHGQWAFTGSRFRHPGPHNPHLFGEQTSRNKAALVVVTKAGIIRLLYQGPDGARWLELKGELDSISTAVDLLTHAAICAEKDQSMLVATHSVSSHIRTYRVGVDWSKQCFVIDHLETIMDFSPLNNAFGESKVPPGLPYHYPQLYDLQIVSPTTDVRKKETIPPLLFAFFCNLTDQNDQSSGANEVSTCIVRWELTSIKPTLHPSFSQLASKKSSSANSSQLQSDVTFKRLQDVQLSKFVVAIRELHLGITLVLCLSDGNVEFRNRSTLGPIPRDDTWDRVSSIMQVGMEFPTGGPCLHAALSPSACALVTLDENNVATVRFMQMPPDYSVNTLDDAVPEAVAVACLMQFNMACGGYGNHHDDLSAIMQVFQQQHLKDRRQQSENFIHTFLSDMYRILQLSVDYSGDIKTEIYLKNVLHQKTLSMQLSLGYRGEQQHRTLSSKVASAALQLRWAALTFAMGLKPNPPGTILSAEAEFNRTETVRSFFGIISWTLSLMNYIMDELFCLLAEVEEDETINQELLVARIHACNTPALALLFVSQSRLLFKYNLRFFRGINAEATQSKSHNPVWREVGDIFSKSPIAPQQFDRVIADVETSIRSVYESNQIPDNERKDIEKNILISGTVPPKLWPAVESLLKKTLRTMGANVNRAELYFNDISWIGLSDDQASDQWRREHRLDIVRKVEVPKRVRIRRCTRCCSVMEDAAPPKGTTGWLVNMWRTCVCGNWWMDIEDKRKDEFVVR